MDREEVERLLERELAIAAIRAKIRLAGIELTRWPASEIELVAKQVDMSEIAERIIDRLNGVELKLK